MRNDALLEYTRSFKANSVRLFVRSFVILEEHTSRRYICKSN